MSTGKNLDRAREAYMWPGINAHIATKLKLYATWKELIGGMYLE